MLRLTVKIGDRSYAVRVSKKVWERAHEVLRLPSGIVPQEGFTRKGAVRWHVLGMHMGRGHTVRFKGDHEIRCCGDHRFPEKPCTGILAVLLKQGRVLHHEDLNPAKHDEEPAVERPKPERIVPYLPGQRDRTLREPRRDAAAPIDFFAPPAQKVSVEVGPDYVRFNGESGAPLEQFLEAALGGQYAKWLKRPLAAPEVFTVDAVLRHLVTVVQAVPTPYREVARGLRDRRDNAQHLSMEECLDALYRLRPKLDEALQDTPYELVDEFPSTAREGKTLRLGLRGGDRVNAR